MTGRDVNAGSGPRIVSWNVTSRCPLACAHCYIDADGRGSPGDLDTAEGMALIDQIAAVGRPILVLSGGEPLLRPDIFDLPGMPPGAGCGSPWARAASSSPMTSRDG
ncbi:protein of unknown function [Methanoculleus bourgensis]|uniref:Radical SAM core domain-containing protein n=1 Tax=Methanoculleus bourgensis TaxID=83986 RepID=A0A0X3BQC9_9EURY|nr:protein of unknown function [Methanoculleus bourgensis]